MQNGSPMLISVDFFKQNQLFSKEDQQLLEELTNGTKTSEHISQSEAVQWLSNRQAPGTRFAFMFLRLLKNAVTSVASLPPEIAHTLFKNPEAAADYVKHYGKRRFLVLLLQHNECWYWLISDSKTNICYWGDMQHGEKFECPDELKWLVYQYNVMRQSKSVCRFERVKSPKPETLHAVSSAAACILAFFTRGAPSAEPIAAFDANDASSIQQKFVLCFAKQSFLFHTLELVDSAAKRQRIEEPEPLEMPGWLDIAGTTIMPWCFPELQVYTPVVRLVDCRLAERAQFPTDTHKVVIAVAILSSVDKAQPTTSELYDYMLSELDMSIETTAEVLASIKYMLPNFRKTAKKSRPIRKQKTSKGNHWVLTEIGFKSFVENTGLCLYSKRHYQQGRRPKKENELGLASPKTLLTQEIAGLLSTPGLTHMDIVAQQLAFVQRPLSLKQIVKSIVAHSSLSASLQQLPLSKIYRLVSTKVRQAVNTGCADKAKRSSRYSQFRVTMPEKKTKTGKEKVQLYAYLTAQESTAEQIRENATELVVWRRFGDSIPRQRFLFVSTNAQWQLITHNANNELVFKETVFGGTLLEIPERANLWTLLNAKSGDDIVSVEFNGKIYGQTMRRIEAGETFTVQLVH